MKQYFWQALMTQPGRENSVCWWSELIFGHCFATSTPLVPFDWSDSEQLCLPLEMNFLVLQWNFMQGKLYYNPTKISYHWPIQNTALKLLTLFILSMSLWLRSRLKHIHYFFSLNFSNFELFRPAFLSWIYYFLSMALNFVSVIIFRLSLSWRISSSKILYLNDLMYLYVFLFWKF